MNYNQSKYIQTSFIALLVLFMCISLLAIYNAQQLPQLSGDNFLLKQLIWFLVGIAVVAFIQLIDLERLYKASAVIYAIGVLILLALVVSPESIAPVIKGQKSWFTLPGLSLQPAEFTKMTTILFLAAQISRHKEKNPNATVKMDLLLLVKIGAIIGCPVFFIMLQPDFGTSMVYVFIAGMMVLLSGIDWKIIIGLVLAAGIFLAGVLGIIIKFPELAQSTVGLEPYQINRVLTWVNPAEQSSDDTFHFDKSIRALGSGQLAGKGINRLQVATPEAHTDFVFSVIGESFGFAGTSVVVFLYFLLMYKLLTLGMHCYKTSPFGAYLCFGYMGIFLIHAFQNIGMTIGIMPITGIPLLLISYGGSSVLAAMIGYGLVYRVAVEHTIQNSYLFKNSPI